MHDKEGNVLSFILEGTRQEVDHHSSFGSKCPTSGVNKLSFDANFVHDLVGHITRGLCRHGMEYNSVIRKSIDILFRNEIRHFRKPNLATK